METVTTYEAKAHLSKLIMKVLATGEPVVVCRNRKPVVDIVPHVTVTDSLVQNPKLAGARFHGDPCGPVAAEDWPEDLR